MNLSFSPPRYWQEFEDLTVEVVPYVFADATPTKVGRPGQCQNGVDVYGTWPRTGGLVGIQCKRMEELDENNQPYPGGVLSEQMLISEYKKALGFQPGLELWILATTAKRDAAIQQVARELSEASKSRGRFGVRIWSWDDYVTFLNNYDDLAKLYYCTVLDLRTTRDEDVAILEVIRMALSRPAFHTSFHRENGEDFEKALKDSQRALDTGELLDRETRHVIRKALGGWRSIREPNWRDIGRKVALSLRQLRADLRDGVAAGTIVKHCDGRMEVLDQSLEKKLAVLRQSCVEDINRVLRDAGMTLI